MEGFISAFIGIAIMGVGEIVFARIALDEDFAVSKKKILVIYLITSILLTLIYTYTEGVTKTLLVCTIHMFEYKLLFKLNYSKAIFLTFLYIIILLIPDMLELFILTNIIGLEKDFCYNQFAGSIPSNIIVCLLFVLVTLILKKPLKKLMKAEISNSLKIIILSLATLICIAMFFYIFAREFKINENVIPYLIAMVVLLVILFILIRQTIQYNKLTNEYDQLLEFMTTYENEIEKQRILRHETKNEFLSIKAKLQDKQKEKEIIEYIDEILKDKIKVKQEEYAKFGYLPPNGIKGLCYFKAQEAENKKVKIALNISSSVKKSNIYNLTTKQQRDFGKILGVILDNAIEASTNSKEKKLGIEAYTTIKKEFKMIISNTFDNDIDKNKIGKEKFSTKGKNRGHGLLLVNHLIENNKIFTIKTEVNNNIYSQTITIKVTEK